MGGVTLAGAAGLLGLTPRLGAAEPPPETTKLTLAQVTGLCVAPQYVAEELLQGEGFTEVQYVKTEGNVGVMKAPGLWRGADQHGVCCAVDHPRGYRAADCPAGRCPCRLLRVVRDRAGAAIRDLKGKTVAVPDLGPGSSQYIFLASMLAYVGLDPGKDVNWVIHSRAEGMRLLAEEKIDAFMGFPPDPQEMRARRSGTWW